LLTFMCFEAAYYDTLNNGKKMFMTKMV